MRLHAVLGINSRCCLALHLCLLCIQSHLQVGQLAAEHLWQRAGHGGTAVCSCYRAGQPFSPSTGDEGTRAGHVRLASHPARPSEAARGSAPARLAAAAPQVAAGAIAEPRLNSPACEAEQSIRRMRAKARGAQGLRPSVPPVPYPRTSMAVCTMSSARNAPVDSTRKMAMSCAVQGTLCTLHTR